MSTRPAARTVGVAIAIPEPFGGWLQARRASFGDAHAGSIPTHITLLPPTELSTDASHDTGAHLSLVEHQSVVEHLSVVASSTAPFEIHLRGTATFRPVSPVVFVQLVEGIVGCELLERQVRRGPLQRELYFPSHPHVTVAHDLPDKQLDEAFKALAGFDCRFEVREFHLYEHGHDGVWRPERAYQLSASAAVGVPASVSQ